MRVREATEDDAAACAAIYEPYVTGTAISFETEPPSAEEMRARIAAAHAWVVLEDKGRVVGYAYGARFHPRAAYRWACEVSVYLEQGQSRRGGGRGHQARRTRVNLFAWFRSRRNSASILIVSTKLFLCSAGSARSRR